jgi:hypothetical protein
MGSKRLIAPLTERWNEGERDWSYVADPSKDIARWEHDTKQKLPDGYRRFMLKFNGGRVYPRLFRYKVPLERYPSNEPVTMVDPFYDWAYVEAHWRGEVYGKGTPPDMLIIGTNPGGLQILLSLRPVDRGHIFCWPHTSNFWGTEGNTQVWHQADSFETFLESLYDEPDGSDYAFWREPFDDELVRPLVF